MGAVSAAAGTQANVPLERRAPPPPPPPPPLSSVQRGDIAAGRLRPVEGRLYDVPAPGTASQAPATLAWGQQAAGTPYRQTFDQVSTRLGTTDPVAVGAEIDRQLYGTTTPVAPAPVAPTGQTAPSQEGVGSFVQGAVLGNFSDNRSWSATAGQVAVGFVPIVGQIADARDTVASIGQIVRGESGGWLNLGASIVGWVPGVGDAAKAAIRGGSNLAEGGADVARAVVRQADNLPPPTTAVNAVQPTGRIDPALTFRADSRPPSEIFANGFQPRGTSTDLLAHALDSSHPPSAFVPTSTSPVVARDFAISGGHDNVYVVRPTNGIDVNRTLGSASPFPHELEIAVPSPGIAPHDVRGLTLEQQGISLLNPNWRP